MINEENAFLAAELRVATERAPNHNFMFQKAILTVKHKQTLEPQLP